jgi:hypothetical protein
LREQRKLHSDEVAQARDLGRSGEEEGLNGILQLAYNMNCYIFRNFASWLTSYWQLGTSCSGDIYTTEIGRHYHFGLLFFLPQPANIYQHSIK